MINYRNLVFLGAPGAGKGTLAAMLSEGFGLPHISTGDIFRNEMKNESDLGLRAKHYVTSGGLVPDELVADMVGARLAHDDCSDGFILDGFPRTLLQADLLDKVLLRIGQKLDRVVFFAAEEELLLKRLTARIICRDCGANFNLVFSPPAESGVCDECGGELYQRPDDSLETAKERLEVFDEQTAPLIPHYERRGILVEIDGGKSKEDSYPELLKVLA